MSDHSRLREHGRPYMQTASGVPFDLLAPSEPDQILLDDIAHALAHQVRYNGHCKPGRAWSVAAHSVLATILLPADAPPLLSLAALLHDAHEAYIGDLTSPVKRALGMLNPATTSAWNALVNIIQFPIHTAFDLPEHLPSHWVDQIKRVDLWALRLERDEVMEPSLLRWTVEDMHFPPTPRSLFDVYGGDVWDLANDPVLAKRIFLRTFDHYDRLRYTSDKDY